MAGIEDRPIDRDPRQLAMGRIGEHGIGLGKRLRDAAKAFP
jgi:hypothetical protein